MVPRKCNGMNAYLYTQKVFPLKMYNKLLISMPNSGSRFLLPNHSVNWKLASAEALPHCLAGHTNENATQLIIRATAINVQRNISRLF